MAIPVTRVASVARVDLGSHALLIASASQASPLSCKLLPQSARTCFLPTLGHAAPSALSHCARFSSLLLALCSFVSPLADSISPPHPVRQLDPTSLPCSPSIASWHRIRICLTLKHTHACLVHEDTPNRGRGAGVMFSRDQITRNTPARSPSHPCRCKTDTTPQAPSFPRTSAFCSMRACYCAVCCLPCCSCLAPRPRWLCACASCAVASCVVNFRVGLRRLRR